MCALGALTTGIAAGAGLAAHTAGAESNAVWLVYDDGCIYLTDGQYNYESACPRSDGAFDFYLPDSGQWVYAFSGTVDQYGCAVVWNNAGSVNSSCFQDWVDSASGSGNILTGNPVIDSILIDTNNEIVDTWLEPNCVEVVGDVCYVP